jgi:hypothetical protein
VWTGGYATVKTETARPREHIQTPDTQLDDGARKDRKPASESQRAFSAHLEVAGRKGLRLGPPPSPILFAGLAKVDRKAPVAYSGFG